MFNSWMKNSSLCWYSLIGVLLSIAYVSIPALLSIADLPESTLLSLWKSNYFRGFHISPPLAVASGIACLANVVYLPSGFQSGRVKCLLMTAALNFSIFPYTALFISPTNKRLMARIADLSRTRAEKETAAESKERLEETRRLCARWGRLNYGRMLLQLGAVVSAWLAL